MRSLSFTKIFHECKHTSMHPLANTLTWKGHVLSFLPSSFFLSFLPSFLPFFFPSHILLLEHHHHLRSIAKFCPFYICRTFVGWFSFFFDLHRFFCFCLLFIWPGGRLAAKLGHRSKQEQGITGQICTKLLIKPDVLLQSIGSNMKMMLRELEYLGIKQ